MGLLDKLLMRGEGNADCCCCCCGLLLLCIVVGLLIVKSGNWEFEIKDSNKNR